MRTSWCFVMVAVVAGEARAELKLGYVDLQRALAEVVEGREAKARLKGEQERTRAALEADKARLASDKAVLDKQAAMMSEEVRNSRLVDWQRRMVEAVQQAERKQQELAERERTELKRIFDKMDPIIAGIAQREGLSVVLEKTDSGLVYALPTLDLTGELVRIFNERHPASASRPKDAHAAPSAAGRP